MTQSSNTLYHFPKVRLEFLEEEVLLIREGGDHPNNAIDSAKNYCGNLTDVGIREAHDQRAVSEPVNELTKVVLTNHLKAAPLLVSGTVTILSYGEEVEIVLGSKVNVIVKNLNS